ncbi:hypothetical protein PA905_24730 [Planktothrix agardhii CCAP 1459/11A]|uniref:Uncharacterized protein n=1 Tax=Planktothrix agardhii CCAP 1459/11A TaxID=282420 RepID=A0A4P6A0J1_PLAAG|nr:hypothetical protein PA905_24730 [Planktothrix agardhii CCAP 1459/11A]
MKVDLELMTCFQKMLRALLQWAIASLLKKN